MTIAACFLLPEGVILAADSTTTQITPMPPRTGGAPQAPVVRYFLYGQKLFEIGENSTLGIVTWGLGGLPDLSYRTVIASFADSLRAAPPGSMQEVAQKWGEYFWAAYSKSLAAEIQAAKQLSETPPVEPGLVEIRTQLVRRTSVGFCVAGRCGESRQPSAFRVDVSPLLPGPPTPHPLPMGDLQFWGVPNMVNRLALGFDQEIVTALLRSGKWGGTPQELVAVLTERVLQLPRIMPLRDAIELVHSLIYTTIKSMKYSHLPPVCGGPIEIAVITTDRNFRWVKHKPFDVALD